MCLKPHFGEQLRDLPAVSVVRTVGSLRPGHHGTGKTMTKYLFEANYVGEGVKGLMRDGGTKRRDAVDEALKSVGGSLESFYYAFGETDVLGVLDIPDQAGAVALSLMINSTGAVNLHLKPLMTPEDIDEAAKKTPSYRAPGQ